MISKKIFCVLIIASFISISLVAQTSSRKIDTTKETKIARFKPPLVRTSLGTKSQTAQATIEEANHLINLPLKVEDSKNNIYTITSYQFMYKKKSAVENEQTGKKEAVFTTVADLFKTTPLPLVWQNNIGGSVQKDEELYFFDIIVKDKLNRKFFAPDLKIRVR